MKASFKMKIGDSKIQYFIEFVRLTLAYTLINTLSKA